jgi:uncharacterized protein
VGLWLSVARQSPPLVEDNAALMDEGQRDFLAQYHDYLLVDHDIDYRVVTVEEAGDVNGYAVERFEELAATSRSETGRGLLLVVDPTQDLVRLEVSYALEGVFPDAFVAYVEHRQMVPFFRHSRVADGILASTELIVTRAQRAAVNAGFEGEIWTSRSGGAGATVSARLGAGPETRPETDPETGPETESATAPAPYSPGRTPAETLQSYFAAMSARNGDPNLAIYTPETRRMLQGWLMTPAQMDNVLKTYRRCRAEPVRFGPGATRAVIRYPISQRDCSPWFFRKLDGGWALDLTMMQGAIRFGRSNAWRFDLGVEHPYRFAFSDWRFDRHGFPSRPR